jgi:hypothetical protein
MGKQKTVKRTYNFLRRLAPGHAESFFKRKKLTAGDDKGIFVIFANITAVIITVVIFIKVIRYEVL